MTSTYILEVFVDFIALFTSCFQNDLRKRKLKKYCQKIAKPGAYER